MAGITLEKEKRIYESGQPMTALHLITTGKVQAEYPGGSYPLGKGDVIGIGELCSEVHFIGYKTLEETGILTYPVNSMDTLNDLMQKHPDVARLFLLSLFRQTLSLLELSSVSELKCAGAYQNLMEDYKKYTALCSRYRIQSATLEGVDDANAFLKEDSPDIWLNSYYLGLQHLYSTDSSRAFLQEPGVSLGMLRKGSLDFRKTYMSLEEHYSYCSQIADFYFNKSGCDLFGMYTALYSHIGRGGEDSIRLYQQINTMIHEFASSSSLTKEEAAVRIGEYKNIVKRINAAQLSSEADSVDNSAIMAELAGSMSTILQFAGEDLDIAPSFRENVYAFMALKDKNSTDEAAMHLRKALTQAFYVLYPILFEKTLTAEQIPVPVKMFLYFGYVDENLAGAENSAILYQLARDMTDNSRLGIYSFYDWLKAIYDGKKEPSRNEFEEDYTDYVHKQKISGNITDAEAAALEKNPLSRVAFELRNMFPSVNRVTFGRITTYCPLFTEDNVVKDLLGSYVDSSKLCKALELIRSVDYSAFYRESLDYENMDELGKQIIHLEYLPDIILMPNVGLRGVMWQEIEGKKRNSPGRMLFSIFHLEDINTTLIRLTGEFRWELCKRIQGYRWNDVSERSLTSEYCDYIQFYRKNHELSNDAKEKIKNSLQKAKNSFREMFVRDYVLWVLFERNGSPRLNKIARKILFHYCPFPADLSAKLAQNPLFSELLERQKIVNGQKLHTIDVLEQRLKKNGSPIPDTLVTERAYLEGTVNNQ